PRPRGAHLSILARGVRGPWRGAAVPAGGADRRVDDRRVPPPAPPGGTPWAAAVAGGHRTAHRASDGADTGPAAAAGDRSARRCRQVPRAQARRGVELD